MPGGQLTGLRIDAGNGLRWLLGYVSRMELLCLCRLALLCAMLYSVRMRLLLPWKRGEG